MKFSDLWHQMDQIRQSDYVFCEPPKGDGWDPPMKKTWQGPPLLLDHRSHYHCLPDRNEKPPLFQLSLKVTSIICSWTARARKKLGILFIILLEWSSGEAGNLCFFELRHESTKVGCFTWIERMCKRSGSHSSSYSGLGPNSEQPRTRYTFCFSAHRWCLLSLVLST